MHRFGYAVFKDREIAKKLIKEGFIMGAPKLVSML